MIFLRVMDYLVIHVRMKWTSLIFLCVGLAGNCLAGQSLTNQTPVAQAQTVSRVTVEEFAKQVGEKDVLILDVRTAKEFNAGHIKGAINQDFLKAGFQTNLATLDKSKTCLVYCAGGGRSAQACKIMSRQGFSKLVDLASGFSGWQKAGQPIEK